MSAVDLGVSTTTRQRVARLEAIKGSLSHTLLRSGTDSMTDAHTPKSKSPTYKWKMTDDK